MKPENMRLRTTIATINETDKETFSQATGEEITIKYYKPENGAWSVLTKAPDEVGTYKAEVALPGVVTSYTPSDGVYSEKYITGTVSAVIGYTIEKATVEITTPPTASEINYGQTLADSNNFTGAVVNPNIEGTFTWANPRIQPAVIDSETTKYTVIFTPTDAVNYETATCEVTVKVNPAKQNVPPPEALAPTYNGAAQALITKGSAEHGIMLYALDDQPETDEGWQNSVPTATDAGEYKVWYKVFGDPNYSDTDAAFVDVTIDKAVVKVSKPPVASAITYGQKLENSALTGSEVEPSAAKGHFEWKEKTTAPAVADSARTQYEVTFVPEDSNNYEADKSYATVVVVPADPTVTPPTVNGPLVYTGEAQNLITEGSAEHGTMKYALGKTAPASKDSWSATVPTGTETGDYIVWYKVFGDTNYNDTGAAPLYVNIYPAQPGAVTPDTLVYNGKEQKLVVPGTVVGGTLQYFVGDDAPTDASQWKGDIPTGTDAGDYKVWYRVKGDANHNDVEPGSVTATIAKAPITPGVSITGWTYGEEANKPAVTGNPGNGEVTVTYSAEKEGTYTTAVPTQAGSWFVKAEVAETKNYQAGTAYPVSFAIAKVNVSIFADNKSGIYGDALHTLTWRMGGETVNGDDLGVTLTTTAKADSAPGDYPITVKWNGNANYSATVVDGVYTVGKQPVTVAAADQTIRSGEQIATGVDHATAIGLVEGHVLSAVTLAADGSAIKASGAKIVDAKGKDVTANYAVSYAAGKLNTLAPGTPAVFPPTAKELTYNGKAQVLVTAGKAEGGTMQYSLDKKTWSKKLPTGTDAGEYTAWYRVKGDADHRDVAASSLKVTIAERKASPDYTLLAKMTTSGSTRLKLSWSEVQGAQGYDVFFKNCDGKQNYTRVTITSKRSYTITGLKKRKAYKAYVVAWKKSGGRKYYIGDASPVVHAITGGYTSKQCNAKSVKLSKSSLTLKVGKSETLKTSVKGVKSGRKVLQHARLVRYYSSDANVAKVNKNGKITAVGKGSCTVYAVANNGVCSKVTVKVN